MRLAIRRFALLGSCLLLLTTACRTFDVHSDWDETIPFDDFQRFYWLEPPQSEGVDPFADNSLLRKRVRTAIERNLTARGFRAVENPDEADFFVTFGVVLDDELRVNGSGMYGGWGYGYGRWPAGYGGVYGGTNVRNYQEGTLIIDVLDPDSEELLWRGWASGFLQTRDRDRSRERFEAGIKAVLDAFPPAKPKPKP